MGNQRIQKMRIATLKMKSKISICLRKEIQTKLKPIQDINAMMKGQIMTMMTLSMKTINSCAHKRLISERLSSNKRVSINAIY